MTDKPSTGLDITPVWARFNDDLIRLVDYVPDDKINWSPKPELWNFRGILIHIASARDNWLTGTVQDGVSTPDVWQTVRSKAEIKDAYRADVVAARSVPRRSVEARRQLNDDDPVHPIDQRPLDRVPPARTRHPPPRRHLPLSRASRHRDAGRRHAVGRVAAVCERVIASER